MGWIRLILGTTACGHGVYHGIGHFSTAAEVLAIENGSDDRWNIGIRTCILIPAISFGGRIR